MNLPQEVSFSKTGAPPVAYGLRMRVRERIAQLVSMLHAKGIALPMPTVSFDLRGKTAGQAWLQKNHVRLNAVLLSENADEFIEQTVGHEVAHLAAHFKHGARIQPHGPQWRHMMTCLGLPAERCHDYDVSRAAVGGTVAWRCGCQVYQLSARRSSTAQKQGYRCRKCHQKLWRVDDAASLGPLRPPTTAPVAPSLPAVPAGRPGALPVVRVATPAMQALARTLSHRLGIVLPPGTLADFNATARFIDELKRIEASRPVLDLPTERQLAFAHRLAGKSGCQVPADALLSRRALSAWINAQLG